MAFEITRQEITKQANDLLRLFRQTRDKKYKDEEVRLRRIVLELENFTIGGTGVTQIIAGTGVTISPVGGTGIVTINASGFPTLTTTGSSGAATLIGGVLNIPNYGSALTGYVPYTGATTDVNLGTHQLLAARGTFANNGSSNTLTVNHTSGSGYGIIVTKGGANEALYVNKTSGSGNAMTVVGGRTSLVDLALSSVSNAAGDFLTLSGGVVHRRTAAQVLSDIGALPLVVGGSLNVNAANPTTLYAGSTSSWSNRGPAANNAGALLNINTHPGDFYSQLWFDTGAGSFYHRAASGSVPTGTWQRVYQDNYHPEADKLTTARQINGTNFDGTGNITTANWGTARTITIGGTGKSVNGSGNVTWTLSEIQAEYRQPINTARTTLFDSTIRDIALFHATMTNKLRFVPATSQEESTDGINWTPSTRASSTVLADIMRGEGETATFNMIPSGTVGTYGGYRLTWAVNPQIGYVFFDHLYLFLATKGNDLNIKIEKLHNTNGWEVVAGPSSVNNWPGHVSIPHSSIPYSASPTHALQVRITFETTRSNTNTIELSAIEWFGAYPAQKRNVESYDRDKNATFPTGLRASDLIITTNAYLATSSGNVGIGNTSPSYKLDVTGTFRTTGKVVLNNATGNNRPLEVSSNEIVVADFRNTGNTNAYLDIIGSGGSSTQMRLGVFGTNVGITRGADNDPDIVINASNNIGIGTIAPQSRLHVEGTSVAYNLIAPTGNATFRMGDSVTSGTRKEFYIILDNTNNRVDIQAVQQGVANRPITLNAGGGNILIGTTTNSSYNLDINGNLRTTTSSLLAGIVAQRNDTSENVIQITQATGAAAAHLYSRGDGYLGWIGLRNTGGTRRFAFESNPGIDSGSHFNLVVYDSAGTNGLTNFTATRTLLTVAQTFRTNTDTYLSATSGRVGIGISPAGAKLTVLGSDETSDGAIAIQTPGATYLKLGGNSTYSWIQTFNSKPLYINALGNDVVFSGAGNILIGTTTSSSYKLDVTGAVRVSGTLFNPGNSNWTNGALRVQGSYGGGISIVDNTYAWAMWAEDGGATFKLGNGLIAGTPTTHLVLKSTGNLLLGTTIDSGHRLNVSGGVNATSYNINGTVGYSGMLVIPTNPPGQQNIDIQGGIIINIF